MKTKLYVAGIGGCLLLLAYMKPYVLFSSTPAEQSQQDIQKSEGLLNFEKSNIPGLEVKTPAKVAIINKLAVAKMKKASLREKHSAMKSSSESNAVAAADRRGDQRLLAGKDTDGLNAGKFNNDEEQQSETSPKADYNTPLVNAPKPGSAEQEGGRTVINYASNSNYAENTSLKKFPREEEAAENAAVKEEMVTHVAMTEKSEKSFAFRGKTTVKSSLFKYIPAYWDGFSEEIGTDKADKALLMEKAHKLARMAAKNGYNTEVAFLLDMSVKSNKNRFFVVNLKTGAIEMSSLVAQGRGSERLNLDKEYSNKPGSNLSSLGMYKIGKPYEGDFGRSYRLYGMDASNRNALQRNIVLHSMGSIPNMETNFPIWQSDGCPSVSPQMLEKLGSIIDGSKKPILMWMYDDTYIPMEGKSVGQFGN